MTRLALTTPPRPPADPDGPLAGPDSAPTQADLARLLSRAAAGDDRAWRSVIELYGRRVYALARSRCGRHDLAEEITQSVFVTVASKLGGRDGAGAGEYTEMGRFESWLFRVAMNRIRDEMRRQKRHAEPTDPATFRTSATPDHRERDPDGGDDLARLRQAIGQLSESDREVVELRHHAGMSFKQMADALQEPIGTLLARHHRALRKLKDLLTAPAHSSNPAAALE